jgi:hypothetical protein
MNDLELKARILAAVAAEPSGPRRTVKAMRWRLLSVAAVLSLAIFAYAGGVRITGRPMALVMVTSVGALAIAAAAAALALRRGRSMVGRSAAVLVGIAVLTPLLLLGWKTGTSSLFSDMTRWWPERPGFRCLTLATAMGLPLTAASLYVWRRTAPAHPRLTGLAIGTAVGALVWVMVDFWCPVAHVHHLLLGHVLPLAAFALVGAAAGGLLAGRSAPVARSLRGA